ncbi:hypothetical protein [Shewanella sp. CG12_big_fil_rev_8_21_14_0_65_47_15]|uniref:hypothetical protein n=1 Tax=Shewanella sp. CG12_big_fil_rev_8_21_14_0_65_47_15 TaxID=1975537 RepID=UPI0025EBD93D|nr:hypothetical protein [Shewanella sp. CG12_big_fil_rev_8_21_14_0_65_47_15]
MLRVTDGTVLEYFVVEAKGPGAKLSTSASKAEHQCHYDLFKTNFNHIIQSFTPNFL